MDESFVVLGRSPWPRRGRGPPSDSEEGLLSARAALAQKGPTDIFQVPVLELRARQLPPGVEGQLAQLDMY